MTHPEQQALCSELLMVNTMSVFHGPTGGDRKAMFDPSPFDDRGNAGGGHLLYRGVEQ